MAKDKVSKIIKKKKVSSSGQKVSVRKVSVVDRKTVKNAAGKNVMALQLDVGKKQKLLKKAGTKVKKAKQAKIAATETLNYAEKLLSKDDHIQALAAADSILGDDTELARAALVRAMALKAPLDQLIESAGDDDDDCPVSKDSFKEVFRMLNKNLQNFAEASIATIRDPFVFFIRKFNQTVIFRILG